MRRPRDFVAVIGLGLAVYILNPAPTLANLLSDPGFESGTPVIGGVGGWEPFGGAAFSMPQALSGDWSMEIIALNFVPGAFQVLPANPGEIFTLTGSALAPKQLNGEPAFGGIQFAFFDADGVDLGTVETGTGNAATDFRGVKFSSGDFVPGEWTPLTVTATAPADTTTIQVFPIYIDFSGNTQGIYVDDMSLILVPEPTCSALAGLALAGLLILRQLAST